MHTNTCVCVCLYVHVCVGVWVCVCVCIHIQIKPCVVVCRSRAHRSCVLPPLPLPLPVCMYHIMSMRNFANAQVILLNKIRHVSCHMVTSWNTRWSRDDSCWGCASICMSLFIASVLSPLFVLGVTLLLRLTSFFLVVAILDVGDCRLITCRVSISRQWKTSQ